MVGYSGFSNEVEIRAAGVPATPDAPVTTVNGANVDITWVAPDDNGSPITAYRIMIQHADGVTYSEDTTDCDGS